MNSARHYHLEKIYPVAEYDQYCHERDERPVSFGAFFHQYQYRAKEIYKQVKEEQAIISAGVFGSTNSLNEIFCFFRLVTIPNEHVLGEP